MNTTYPASAPQQNLINILMGERDLSGINVPVTAFLTSNEARNLINLMKAQPYKRSPQVETPEVPAGTYAIEVDGKLCFVRVEHGKGRWAGRTFVKQQAGDDLYPVRGSRANTMLALIAEDPRAAMALYGHEIGRCGRCGRTLTDAESRELGIGPVCVEKLGW